MVFHENFGFLGSPAIFGGIGIVVFIFILIWIGMRSREAVYGTYQEKDIIKHLGYAWSAFRWTGRKVISTLKWGIRNSIRLGKFAYRAGKRGGRLAKDFAKYTSRLVKGEQENISLELHETAAGAASVELATVIGKLVNSEFNEHKAKESIELRLRFLDQQLSQLSNMPQMDDEARKFIVGLGQQITSALMELANHENLELHQRGKSFDEARRLLKVIKAAETLAQRLERRAINNQIALSRFNKRELNDLKQYLNDTLKAEKRKIDSANRALAKGEVDSATKAALYQEIQLSMETSERIRQNVTRLLQILGQLKAINLRMLRALVKIADDTNNVLGVVYDAYKKEGLLKNAEKNVEKNSKEVKTASKEAETNFKAMQKESPEEIIIGLTKDAGSILSKIADISRTIRGIDSQELIPLMEDLLNAMKLAFKVEESSRLANRFYAKLMDANERFYQLVTEADFKQEIKDTFTQEIRIEEMEKQIAAREESVAQATKSLFIRTANITQNTMGNILQHIDYLNNNIALTIQTRDYTLFVLGKLMESLHVHKIRVNQEFGQRADEYQQRLNQVRLNAGLARLAA